MWHNAPATDIHCMYRHVLPSPHEIRQRHRKPLESAKTFAQVSVVGGECVVDQDIIEATLDGDMMVEFVCPEDSRQIANSRQCAGRGFEVALECANPEFVCVRRNNRFSQCRRDGIPGLGSWEGSILPCGAPSNIRAGLLPAPAPAPAPGPL